MRSLLQKSVLGLAVFNMSFAQLAQADTFNVNNPVVTGSANDGQKHGPINFVSLPGFPTTGGTGATSGSGPTIINPVPGTGGTIGTGGIQTPTPNNNAIYTGIPKSSIPGMVCLLIDNQPNLDLVTAVNKLNTYVKPAINCGSGKPGSDSVNAANPTFQNAVTGLQKYYTDYQMNKDNPTFNNPNTVADIQNKILDVKNGLETIASSVSNNNLFNSTCMNTGMDYLSSVSDVAAALAPIASMALKLPGISSIPEIGAAAMGLSAVGTFAKMFGDDFSKNSIDMQNPDNRTALLQNTCEYVRIRTRLQYLIAAQTHNLSDVTKDIDQKIQSYDETIKSNIDPHVQQLLAIRSQVQSKIDAPEDTYKLDAREMTEILKDLVKTTDFAEATTRISDANQTNDPLKICNWARKLVKSTITADGSPYIFPMTAINNFHILIANQPQPFMFQLSVIDNESSTRAFMLQGLNDNSILGLANCAAEGRSYIAALIDILDKTKQTIDSQNASLENQLDTDGPYHQYSTVEKPANNEKNEIKAMTETMSDLDKLNQGNASPGMAELQLQLDNIEHTLFGVHYIAGVDQWNSFYHDHNHTFPPALDWFQQYDKEFHTYLKLFSDGFRETLAQPNLDKKSAAYQNSRMCINIFAMSGPGSLIPASCKDYSSIWTNYTGEELPYINVKNYPVGSAEHGDICTKLQNVWTNWVATMNFLSSENLFCEVIAKSINPAEIDSRMVKYCIPLRDDQKKTVTQTTLVDDNIALLAAGGTNYTKKAMAVSKAMTALQCSGSTSPRVSAAAH